MDYQINESTFLERITALLSKFVGRQRLPSSITFETILIEGVGENGVDLSSIDYVDFLTRVEDDFDIAFDFETMIYTIGDIYHYIHSYKEREYRNE